MASEPSSRARSGSGCREPARSVIVVIPTTRTRWRIPRRVGGHPGDAGLGDEQAAALRLGRARRRHEQPLLVGAAEPARGHVVGGHGEHGVVVATSAWTHRDRPNGIADSTNLVHVAACAPHDRAAHTATLGDARRESAPRSGAIGAPRSITTMSPSCIVCSTCSSGLPTPPPKRYAEGSFALRLQAHRQRTSDHATLPDSARFDSGKHAQDREFVERVGDDRSRVLRSCEIGSRDTSASPVKSRRRCGSPLPRPRPRSRRT